jgi:uncharacterized protein (TIGR02646 family)
MRYVPKINPCVDFENYKISASPLVWRDFNNTSIKLALHQHLWQEQKGLCVYCQQEIPKKITIDSAGNIHPSHIEHIRPKSIYPNLAFEHNNLSISCEGYDIANPPSPIRKSFCGHLKENEYDATLFLHPFENPAIEEYFGFNLNGEISGNGKDDAKANYCILKLGLDNAILTKMREDSYLLVIEEVTNNGLDINEYLDSTYTQLPAFYSMLKQLFHI